MSASYNIGGLYFKDEDDAWTIWGDAGIIHNASHEVCIKELREQISCLRASLEEAQKLERRLKVKIEKEAAC